MKLCHVIEQYVTLKQSLGFRFRTERRILRGFGRAMGKITVGQVSPVAVRTYLDGPGPVTSYWMRKWGTLRGLYRFALARGLARRCPVPLNAPKVAVPFTPYIYSQPELRRLLQAITPERTKGLSPQTMRGFHEILPGLGAFAIAPDDDGKPKGIDGPGQLSGFLKDVLENLCNRASLREERSSSLYEALRERRALYSAGKPADAGNLMLQDAPELDSDNLRIPAATDITVLVAWFDSVAAKQWMLDNRKIILRLGNRRGTLPLIKSLASASHILLHGRSYQTVPGLFRIGPQAGEIWTRAEVQAAGFPSGAGKPKDDIFAVFSVRPDDAFKSLSWDAHRLEEALLRFITRQRPTYRIQLNELRREKAKPQLASIADLQAALAQPPA